MNEHVGFSATGSRQPRDGESGNLLDPSLTVYLDESGNGNPTHPLIVGAAACDEYVGDTEDRIRALYRDLASRRSLVGLPSFDTFVAEGFHASANPPEVAGAFRELVLNQLSLKVYMLTTDRTTMAPRAEVDQIEEMYTRLIADILLNARRRVGVHCIFEQNDELKGLLSRLPETATRRAAASLTGSSRLPSLTVEMKPKMEAMSIAVIDFAMLAVSKWIRADFVTDPRKREYRAFREVEPMISLLYSLEIGLISSRSSPLH